MHVISSALAHVAVFVILVATIAIAQWGGLMRRVFGARRARPPGRQRLLLTGTFYNENWFRSHILPLSATTALERIYVVTDQPLCAVDKVEYVCPPGWLRRLTGRTFSRAMAVTWAALRHRPDVLMGYHIMPNAIICLVVASLLGGKAVYQMTGGPLQIIGGGTGSENALLQHLGRHSKLLEKYMFAVVRLMNIVVVRGSTARDFVTKRRVAQSCLVLTGSVDTEQFCVKEMPKQYDVVYVSRLRPYKGLEYLLELVAELKRIRPRVRVAIVGDGQLRSALQSRASELGVNANVSFLGHKTNAAEILQQSRLFVLTSPSEGMSIAMLEAMSAGLPVAVTAVGDLPDAVCPGSNGVFLAGSNPVGDAQIVDELLDNEELLSTMSSAARERIDQRYSVQAVAAHWDKYFDRHERTDATDEEVRGRANLAMPSGRAREETS